MSTPWPAAGLTLTARTLFGHSFGSREAASWFHDLLSLHGHVQTNAAVGFRTGVVRVTADEYESALALSRDRPLP